MSGFVLLRGVPRRCADHARTRRQRDDAGLADPPHPAAERHLDAEILACLEKCCRTVDLDLLVGDREPNGAALPAVIGAGDGEPFDVQPVSQAAVLVVRLHRVEQRHRPAGPAFPLTPIRRPLVHPATSNLPISLVNWRSSWYCSASSASFSISSRKITSSRVGAEWMWTMSGVCPCELSWRSIAMTGVMPLPAVTKRILPGTGSVDGNRPG